MSSFDVPFMQRRFEAIHRPRDAVEECVRLPTKLSKYGNRGVFDRRGVVGGQGRRRLHQHDSPLEPGRRPGRGMPSAFHPVQRVIAVQLVLEGESQCLHDGFGPVRALGFVQDVIPGRVVEPYLRQDAPGAVEQRQPGIGVIGIARRSQHCLAALLHECRRQRSVGLPGLGEADLTKVRADAIGRGNFGRIADTLDGGFPRILQSRTPGVLRLGDYRQQPMGAVHDVESSGRGQDRSSEDFENPFLRRRAFLRRQGRFRVFCAPEGFQVVHEQQRSLHSKLAWNAAMQVL